ncbi:hypothetical protein [Defluviimonas salinarum]|uniref:Uncharacterized protein n=1 Tax=Defluviimonas salinarum TaxID=2992147 RepID=A0ABT3J7B9_9RHOB|nr:hypothetical protein [Defluviimonas salinarum]MCW3783590.1 hypothetical protein [Defluviimonas salinarum]
MPLPGHGPIDCRLCWQDCGSATARTLEEGRYRLVNDPGAWGARDPKILVLGMTKGNTQSGAMAAAMADGSYDGVPFASFRPRLLEVLKTVGLMAGVFDIDRFFREDEADYGWGSLLRCSFTARDANGTYLGKSGPVITGMSRKEGFAVLTACARRHLEGLSSRTRLVVLLGNDDRYMALVARAMATVFPDYAAHPELGPVVFRAGGRFFVHVAHPSKGNGCYGAFLTGPGNTGQGAKRAKARAGIRGALGMASATA